MKKVLFVIMMMMVCMTPSLKAEKWSNLGPNLAKEVNNLSGYIAQEFQSQGIPATAKAAYSSATKSVDIYIDFGDLDIIPYLDNSVMNECKQGFLTAFIASMRESGSMAELREMADIMIKDNGSLRIVFLGAGQQKSVSITGQDIKRAM